MSKEKSLILIFDIVCVYFYYFISFQNLILTNEIHEILLKSIIFLKRKKKNYKINAICCNIHSFN